MSKIDERWEANKQDLAEAAAKAGIEPGLMAKIAGFESGYNPHARPIAGAKHAELNTVTQFDGTKAMSSAYGYGQFLDLLRKPRHMLPDRFAKQPRNTRDRRERDWQAVVAKFLPYDMRGIVGLLGDAVFAALYQSFRSERRFRYVEPAVQFGSLQHRATGGIDQAVARPRHQS